MMNLSEIGEQLSAARNAAQRGLEVTNAVTPERLRIQEAIASALAAMQLVDQAMAVVKENAGALVDQAQEGHALLLESEQLVISVGGGHPTAKSAAEHLGAAEGRLGGMTDFNPSWTEDLSEINDYAKGVVDSNADARDYVHTIQDVLVGEPLVEVNTEGGHGIALIEHYAESIGAPLASQ